MLLVLVGVGIGADLDILCRHGEIGAYEMGLGTKVSLQNSNHAQTESYRMGLHGP